MGCSCLGTRMVKIRPVFYELQTGVWYHLLSCLKPCHVFLLRINLHSWKVPMYVLQNDCDYEVSFCNSPTPQTKRPPRGYHYVISYCAPPPSLSKKAPRAYDREISYCNSLKVSAHQMGMSVGRSVKSIVLPNSSPDGHESEVSYCTSPKMTTREVSHYTSSKWRQEMYALKVGV